MSKLRKGEKERLAERQSPEELFYEAAQVQTLETRLKRKDVLLQEQQKKIKSLKQRITRLEEEAHNRNRTIASYQAELIQFSKELEERRKEVYAWQEAYNRLKEELETAKHQNNNEEMAALKGKVKALEQENAALRVELKQKQQDLAMVSRDLKESKRVYQELQESFDVLLNQNAELDKQVTELRRIKEEMDSRYTKTLDNLKAEVRLRQGECSKLLRELQELKREKEDLERLVDGLELKAEVLSSNHASLQRKFEKLNRQKLALEEQASHFLVRMALAIVRFFSRREEGEGSVSSSTTSAS